MLFMWSSRQTSFKYLVKTLAINDFLNKKTYLNKKNQIKLKSNQISTNSWGQPTDTKPAKYGRVYIDTSTSTSCEYEYESEYLQTEIYVLFDGARSHIHECWNP